MIRTTLNGYDGKAIAVTEWKDAKEPIGILQISHGMAEHAMRYDRFAKEMNRRGIIVIADDHRAHGLTDKNNLGYAPGDVFGDTLKDLAAVSAYATNKYALPIVLFGHSYGSFLAQEYVKRYNYYICGAIIGGSNYLRDATVPFGYLVSVLGCAFKGGAAPAKLLKKLSFDVYDKKCGGSFISSIKDEAESYKRDELCGFSCSYNFYKSFFRGARKLYKLNKNQIPGDGIPLLLISGRGDPVGNFGKGVYALKKWYDNHGAKAEILLFDSARHEYLNDVCRSEAENAVFAFCKSAFSKNLRGNAAD